MHRSLLLPAALTLALAACNQTPPPAAAGAPAPASASAAAPPAPTSASAAAPPAATSIGGVAISKNEVGEPRMMIDPADQRCSSNADCSMVVTQCACDCGSPINGKSKQKYIDALQPMCRNYKGRLCKMVCTGTVFCDGGVCRIKE